MKDTMKDTIRHLIKYARSHDIKAEFFCHYERGSLLRFAQSAVSLNTHEDSVHITVTAYQGNACGTCEITSHIDDHAAMERAVLQAHDIARHATPTQYDRTFTALPEQPDDDALYSAALADTSSEDQLAYVQSAMDGVENDALSLSGIISSGGIMQATGNTLSDVILFHAMSDANTSLVLQHKEERWEIAAGQSAVRTNDMQPAIVRNKLKELAEIYMTKAPVEMTPGEYTVVFGADALAELAGMMQYIGFNGGMCKRQRTFLKEEHIGTEVFDSHISIIDDPSVADTYPYAFDLNGITRSRFPLVENGVFKQFVWDRDSADEFDEKETGHTVPESSIVIAGGDVNCSNVNSLINISRDTDVLFLPHLHYMNIVNPTQGIVTCSSRFGALVLRKDGSVDVPYNVRMTENFFTVFKNIDWLSSAQTVVNTSSSYGERNPSAVVVPSFTQVNGVHITHANTSF